MPTGIGGRGQTQEVLKALMRLSIPAQAIEGLAQEVISLGKGRIDLPRFHEFFDGLLISLDSAIECA